jgi:hypothetical protein
MQTVLTVRVEPFDQIRVTLLCDDVQQCLAPVRRHLLDKLIVACLDLAARRVDVVFPDAFLDLGRVAVARRGKHGRAQRLHALLRLLRDLLGRPFRRLRLGLLARCLGLLPRLGLLVLCEHRSDTCSDGSQARRTPPTVLFRALLAPALLLRASLALTPVVRRLPLAREPLELGVVGGLLRRRARIGCGARTKGAVGRAGT